MSKKRRRTPTASPEQIKRIEKTLGVTFLDFPKGIFLFDGIVWKPVANSMEYLCAAWDNIPMVRISAGGSTCRFVPLSWNP